MSTQDEAERRYHRAMARLCVDRGFIGLAQSHLVAAKDCPRGCPCSGCESTRLEAEEKRRVKELRRRAA